MVPWRTDADMTPDHLARLTAALTRLEAELGTYHHASQAAFARCWREIERLRAPATNAQAVPVRDVLQRLADFVYATAQTPAESYAATAVRSVEKAVTLALTGWVARWRGEDGGHCIREFLAEALGADDPVAAGARSLERWAVLWSEADAADAAATALRAACASLPSPPEMT